MTTQSLELHYDAEADLLEIFLGTPTPCLFEEIEDDLFEGRDENTHELKGYKIFNLRGRGGMKDIKIRLPAGVTLRENTERSETD